MANLPTRPNTQPNQDLGNLLDQGKERLYNKLAKGPTEPTEGDQFSNFMNVLGAAQSGGAAVQKEQQRQTQNQFTRDEQQFAQDEQLRAILATVSDESLRISAQVIQQQANDGDVIAKQFALLWPDEFQRAQAGQKFLVELMDIVASDPNITDDDQISMPQKMAILRKIAEEQPAAVVEDEDPTGLMKEAEFRFPGDVEAQQNWVGEIRAKAQTEIIMPGAKAETAFRVSLSENEADRVTKIRDSAERATSDKFEIERMKVAIESGKFTTGSLSDARVFLGRLADYFVGPELTQDPQWVEWVGDAATADTMDAASKRLAVEASKDAGRNTNMMLRLIEGSLPALSRTPEGNLILLEVMDRVSNRDIAIGGIVNNYARAGSLQPEGQQNYFDAVKEYDKSNPVITHDLRKRMAEATKRAPRSFQASFDAQLPPGVPKGSVQTGITEPDGFPVYTLPDGSEMVYE